MNESSNSELDFNGGDKNEKQFSFQTNSIVDKEEEDKETEMLLNLNEEVTEADKFNAHDVVQVAVGNNSFNLLDSGFNSPAASASHGYETPVVVQEKNLNNESAIQKDMIDEMLNNMNGNNVDIINVETKPDNKISYIEDKIINKDDQIMNEIFLNYTKVENTNVEDLNNVSFSKENNDDDENQANENKIHSVLLADDHAIAKTDSIINNFNEQLNKVNDNDNIAVDYKKEVVENEYVQELADLKIEPISEHKEIKKNIVENENCDDNFKIKSCEDNINDELVNVIIQKTSADIENKIAVSQENKVELFEANSENQLINVIIQEVSANIENKTTVYKDSKIELCKANTEDKLENVMQEMQADIETEAAVPNKTKMKLCEINTDDELVNVNKETLANIETKNNVLKENKIEFCFSKTKGELVDVMQESIKDIEAEVADFKENKMELCKTNAKDELVDVMQETSADIETKTVVSKETKMELCEINIENELVSVMQEIPANIETKPVVPKENKTELCKINTENELQNVIVQETPANIETEITVFMNASEDTIKDAKLIKLCCNDLSFKNKVNSVNVDVLTDIESISMFTDKQATNGIKDQDKQDKACEYLIVQPELNKANVTQCQNIKKKKVISAFKDDSILNKPIKLNKDNKPTKLSCPNSSLVSKSQTLKPSGDPKVPVNKSLTSKDKNHITQNKKNVVHSKPLNQPMTRPSKLSATTTKSTVSDNSVVKQKTMPKKVSPKPEITPKKLITRQTRPISAALPPSKPIKFKTTSEPKNKTDITIKKQASSETKVQLISFRNGPALHSQAPLRVPKMKTAPLRVPKMKTPISLGKALKPGTKIEKTNSSTKSTEIKI